VSEASDEGSPLELTPTSRRIGRLADRLVARHPEQAAARIGRLRIRPVECELDTEPPDLTRIDTDPAHMQGVKVTEEPRPMDRPERVHDDLETCTPQFTLRNTWRMEKNGDPEWLDFERRDVSVQSVAEDLELARSCRFDRGDRTPSLTSEEIRVSVARRRVLMVETRWCSIFGRAEPAAVPVDPNPDSTV
jgi:hypothetical protein